MRAGVKYFEWTDLERSGLNASQVDETLLVFAAGPIGERGEETFQATVCTTRGLDRLVQRDGVVFGRHFIFVQSINTEVVEAAIRDRLRRIDGETWTEVAEKIARLGYWEFEDYTEHA